MAEGDNENEPFKMGEGAVAIADALGFREAARTPEGAQGLVEAVRETRKVTSTETDLNNLLGEAHIHYAAVSDTIILACQPYSSTMAQAVARVASSVVSMQAAAARTRLPLAYRGCLAAGPLYVAEDDLFVGKAIDRPPSGTSERRPPSCGSRQLRPRWWRVTTMGLSSVTGTFRSRTWVRFLSQL
jgi:hypothetical protein